MSVQTTSLLCSKPFNGFSLSFFQSGVSIPVATVDTGDWKALCCENCLAHGKMLRNHPWPHPAPASACLHPYLSRDNQKCHRTLLMSPRGKTTPCWEQLPWHKLLIPYDNLQDYSWVTCSSWEPGRGWCHMDREDRMTEWWVSPQSRLEYCYQKGGGGMDAGLAKQQTSRNRHSWKRPQYPLILHFTLLPRAQHWDWPGAMPVLWRPGITLPPLNSPSSRTGSFNYR